MDTLPKELITLVARNLDDNADIINFSSVSYYYRVILSSLLFNDINVDDESHHPSILVKYQFGLSIGASKFSSQVIQYSRRSITESIHDQSQSELYKIKLNQNFGDLLKNQTTSIKYVFKNSFSTSMLEEEFWALKKKYFPNVRRVEITFTSNIISSFDMWNYHIFLNSISTSSNVSSSRDSISTNGTFSPQIAELTVVSSLGLQISNREKFVKFNTREKHIINHCNDSYNSYNKRLYIQNSSMDENTMETFKHKEEIPMGLLIIFNNIKKFCIKGFNLPWDFITNFQIFRNLTNLVIIDCSISRQDSYIYDYSHKSYSQYNVNKLESLSIEFSKHCENDGKRFFIDEESTGILRFLEPFKYLKHIYFKIPPISNINAITRENTNAKMLHFKSSRYKLNLKYLKNIMRNFESQATTITLDGFSNSVSDFGGIEKRLQVIIV